MTNQKSNYKLTTTYKISGGGVVGEFNFNENPVVYLDLDLGFVNKKMIFEISFKTFSSRILF